MSDKFIFTDPVQISKEAKLKISTLLPKYIQTRTNRNFFDATFQTVFSNDSSEEVSGYIGEKPIKLFNSSTDFYIDEVSKDRENYQLSPVVVKVNDDGSYDSQVFYTDIVDHLRYQGANVDSHERLFRQEFYSFSPMIDIDKFVNFNQYYWLEKGPITIDFVKKVDNIVYNTFTFNITNHGFVTGQEISLSGNLPPELSENTPYFVIKENDSNFKIAISENNALGGLVFEFSSLNFTNATVNIKTDFNSIIGKSSATILGISLKSGMVIRTYNDVDSKYNNLRFIVEGVGESIQLLLLDELLGYDSSPYDTQPYDYDEISYIPLAENIDYITMQRGSKDQNIWSMRNRWFHISVLTDQQISSALRAKGPIIEYKRNIKLFNFGENGKGLVNVVYDNGNIQDVSGLSSAIIDGISVFDGMKVLVINDIDDLKNNKIYKIFGLELGSISFIELDTVENDDTVFVSSGNNYGNKHIYLKNENWVIGQIKNGNNSNILFQLYDSEGTDLNNESVYPSSSFNGSKLFGYKENSSFPLITHLNKNVEKNEFDDFVFTNYLDIERFNYQIDFQQQEIIGSYYFKINDQFHNHWHKSDLTINQGIIDEFVIDPSYDDFGNPSFDRIYKLSQAPKDVGQNDPATIFVYFDGKLLVRNVDYEVTNSDGQKPLFNDRYIRLSDSLTINNGSFLKVITYNDKPPVLPISGYYEVPSLIGLITNTNNENITEFGRNDIFEHFISILERQNGFFGDALGINNSVDININYGRGKNIVQNTAPITKTAILNSYKETDILDSIKYVTHEYNRFYQKFNNKIIELNNKGYNERTPYEEWINLAIDQLNIGKTEEFPFEFSLVAFKKFIPSSPSYLGITSMYNPMAFYDTSLTVPQIMIRKHDGQLVQPRCVAPSTFQEVTVVSSQTDYVLNQSVVYPWEIVVTYNNETLVPNVDYTIFGGNSIRFSGFIGNVNICFLNDIVDKVTLYFEHEIYNSSPFKEETYKSEFNFLKHIPGYFRNTDYSVSEFNSIMSKFFNNWAYEQGADTVTNNSFDSNNNRTWNYSNAFAPDGSNLSGTWKSVFLYFYDSVRPNTHPWEMLGFTEKPSWWSKHYGYAPYTNENALLWNDIEAGYIRDGIHIGYYEYLKRPNIKSIIPVDNQGNIRNILDIFPQTEPPIQLLSADWKFGDVSPIEFEFMRSSYYSFALMSTLYLMKPNEFVDLLWEPENNKRVFENQDNSQLVSKKDLTRIQNSNLEIHNTVDSSGKKITKYGLQQYIVDYLVFQGKTAEYLRNIVNNISVRLGYRCGGFIDNKTTRFVSDSFGLVPSENYKVKIHKSASKKEVKYSGIILQKVDNGYQVYGYDNILREFDIAKPVLEGPYEPINVGGKSPNIFEWVSNVNYQEGTYVKFDRVVYRCIETHRSGDIFDSSKWFKLSNIPVIGGISVKKYLEYNGSKKIPYYTTLKSPQEIVDLLIGYEQFLKNSGVVFDNDEYYNNISSFSELLSPILQWVNSSPSVGDTRAISPLSQTFKLENSFGFVESINDKVNGQWSVINGNNIILTDQELMIDRDNDYFGIMIDSNASADSMFGIRLSVSEIEHIVIFDNVTNFSDIIFDDKLGIRQQRLKAFIIRSDDWNGKMKADGFIIGDDGINSNFDKSVSDFTKFYDIDDYVFGENLNAASKKLIGYETKNYFKNLLFDDRDSVQFYIGSIREKGTNKSINKLLRNNYVRNISNIAINEEWAIRIGDYGAISSYSNIDVELNVEDFKSNPQIIKFLESGIDDIRNSVIEIGPDDERFVFKRPLVENQNQFDTNFVNTKLPYAGYLLLDEAQIKLPSFNSSYLYNSDITINENDRMWVAEIGNGDWNVYKLIKDSEILDMKILNGEFIIDVDTVNVSENQIILVNMPNFKSIYKVVNINGNTITLDTFGDLNIEDQVFQEGYNIFTLDSVRFSDIQSYVKKDDGLHFIDNYNNLWAVLQDDVTIRQQGKQVSYDNTLFAKLYDKSTFKNLSNLDFYHPLQNILPFVVRQNIDYIISADPAKYNSPTASVGSQEELWLNEKVGSIWWDLNTVKFIDYDQSSDIYKTNHWGAIFPGTSVDIYQWIRAPYPPEAWDEYLATPEGSTLYSENSSPYSLTDYVENVEYSTSSGRLLRFFYYWVKNNDFIKNSISRKKTKSTNELRDIITNPTKAGIRWLSPISNDTFVISNVSEVLNDDTVLKIIFKNSSNENNVHSEWYLFGDKTDDRNPPKHIFDKLQHSLAGFVQFSDTVENLYSQGFTQDMIDEYGSTLNGITTLRLPVPDDKLVSITKYGNYFRPRQSWFQDIYSARVAFIDTVNNLLSKEIWTEKSPNWEEYLNLEEPQPNESEYDYKVPTLFDRDNLMNNLDFFVGSKVLVENDITLNGRWSLWEYTSSGFVLISRQGFRLYDYWEFADYYADGFSSETFINKEYPDLLSRNLDIENLEFGSIVKVLDDGSGNFVINQYTENGFNIIGKQNGTFKFDKFICICPFAEDAINNLYVAFNNAVSTINTRNIMVIEMIKEAMRQNRILDWAFKTSIVDIIGLEEELIQRPVFSPNLVENIYDYFNEFKPYHTKIRSAIDKKTSNDDFINIKWDDIKNDEVTIIIDKVSCIPDFTQEIWTAAERIANFGGNPSDIIPGCKFRGTEIDAMYFNFFNNVYDYGYDSIPYDGSILGYDYEKSDIQVLYDVIINGKDFTSLPSEFSNIIDGGSFYQPLMSENRPPELTNFRMGDTLSIDVYTSPLSIEIAYGYDVQPYDAEVNEFNEPVGYDFSSPDTFSFILRPKMVQNLYVGNGVTNKFNITQKPQSNESIFVYLNDKLIEEYQVFWNGFKPYVEFDSVPKDGDRIKILSYSIGGISNTIYEKYEKDIPNNVFETNATITTNNVVFATVNGNEVLTETFVNGSTDLSNTQIRIPSANIGDTVYIVVFDGEGFTKVTSQKVTYNNEPIPSEGNIIGSKVYKNGKLLVPSYIRYFDPIEATNEFYSNELLRKKYMIKMIVDKSEYNQTLYDLNGKFVVTNNDINQGSEVILLNDVNAEYRFENNNLYIHTVADATVVRTSIPNNSRININGGICVFSIPSGENIPVDVEIGFFNLIGSTIIGNLTSSGILTIDNTSISFDTSDDVYTLRDKINGINPNIRAYVIDNRIYMKSHGYGFTLSGDWASIGMINGSYKTIVEQLQDFYNSDYRFLTLDGYLRIIWRQGKHMSILPSGSLDVPELFGLSPSYTNIYSRIIVNNMDNDDLANIRTEVYEGNLVGEYPVTRNGFSDYSTIVSVIGNDSIKFSNFDFDSVDFGYDFYGYDNTYDYSNNPGIVFNMPHNQKETVVITTYNGNPRDAKPAFKLFKNLRNEVSYYNIFDEYKTVISSPVYTNSDEIEVKDISVLGKPNPEFNTPAYIWVNGEIIGYFEIDEVNNKLKKLIRGAMGTPFGLTTNGEFIEPNTEIFNMTDSKFNIKDSLNYLNM
jgi:hypothetical protein